MRYFMTFSYDGSQFFGYQRQSNKRSVQGELERALTRINGQQSVCVHAAGRTDKGVHAIGQTAHFDMDVQITPNKLKQALNTYTKDDIYVREIKIVDDSFHARYDALFKQYTYKINLGEYNPFQRKYVYQYNKTLDIDKMREASTILIGTMDYKAFVPLDEKKDHYIRTIEKIQMLKEESILSITFIGDGFMKYQIRNMVGALIKIGESKFSKEQLEKIVNSRDRTKLGKMAPAEGLYLDYVCYFH